MAYTRELVIFETDPPATSRWLRERSRRIYRRRDGVEFIVQRNRRSGQNLVRQVRVTRDAHNQAYVAVPKWSD